MNYLINDFSISISLFCNNYSFIDDNQFKCYTKHNFLLYNKYSCKICGNEYFQTYNNLNDNYSYINCYESPVGYYFDENDFLFKSCYFSCKSCDIDGNEIQHNCFECKDDYTIELNISNYRKR